MDNESFSFEKDSSMLVARSENNQHILLKLKGTKSERLDQFMKLHKQKADSIKSNNK